MVNTMETAIDLATGKLDVCDLVDNIQFISDIDESLKKLADKDLYSGVQIARKRKQIMDRIASLKEDEAEEEE